MHLHRGILSSGFGIAVNACARNDEAAPVQLANLTSNTKANTCCKHNIGEEDGDGR